MSGTKNNLQRKDRDSGERVPRPPSESADRGSVFVAIGTPVARVVAPGSVRADDVAAVGRIGMGAAAVGVLGVAGLGAWWWLR